MISPLHARGRVARDAAQQAAGDHHSCKKDKIESRNCPRHEKSRFWPVQQALNYGGSIMARYQGLFDGFGLTALGQIAAATVIGGLIGFAATRRADFPADTNPAW